MTRTPRLDALGYFASRPVSVKLYSLPDACGVLQQQFLSKEMPGHEASLYRMAGPQAHLATTGNDSAMEAKFDAQLEELENTGRLGLTDPLTPGDHLGTWERQEADDVKGDTHQPLHIARPMADFGKTLTSQSEPTTTLQVTDSLNL